jgi:predicted DNA-binding antitoxin AbrB/MazE fold protein
MPLTVEAIYENGVLKPVEPLPLKEHERVLLQILPGETPLLRAYGILGWQESAELADFCAMDPELDFPPPPEEP